MGLSTRRVGFWIAQRYPEDWRRRHGADLDGYLDVRGIRARDVAGLFFGLLDAHVQMLTWKGWWPTMNRHVTRGLVLSAAAVVLLLVESGSVVKASEDGAVATLTQVDLVARLGLVTVVAAASLGAVAVVLGYAGVVSSVVRRLSADADATGLAALMAPVFIGAGLLAELLLIANFVDGHRAVSVAVLATSGLLGVAVSLWCLATALRRAELQAVPARPAVPAAGFLALLVVVGLLGEALWASRVATLPAWSHLTGVISMPMPSTVIATAACSVVALALAVRSRREITAGASV